MLQKLEVGQDSRQKEHPRQDSPWFAFQKCNGEFNSGQFEIRPQGQRGSLNSGWRLTEKDVFVGSLEHLLVNIWSVALCLNPQCQKRVPSKSSTCAFCGGSEISEFNTYTKSEALADEISIENFHKVVKNSKPFIERTIINDGAKISFKSKLVVRFQFMLRDVLRRK